MALFLGTAKTTSSLGDIKLDKPGPRGKTLNRTCRKSFYNVDSCIKKNKLIIKKKLKSKADIGGINNNQGSTYL